MSRRRHRNIEDLDPLLPNDVLTSTSGTTVNELQNIVVDLQKELDDVVEKYEGRISDLTERLESIETDFKQIIQSLGGTPAPTAASQPTAGPSGPPNIGGASPPPGPPTGGPQPPKLG